MSDLSITAASVVPVRTGSFPAVIRTDLLAGEAITAGQSLYIKSSDQKLWKAQCDGVASEEILAGIALNSAAAGQPMAYVGYGDVTIGATLTQGGIYVISATLGGICPVADLASTNKLSMIGFAVSSSVLRVMPIITGIAIP